MSPLQFRVTAVESQPAEVITICLAPLNGEAFSYVAGQFLTFIFKQGNRELRRSYSICSSPFVEEPLQIAVKAIENGEISRWMHHQIRIGDQVDVSGPNGLFTYVPEEETSRTVFLLAAGVGIAPLFAILKTALVAENRTKVVLIYSSRGAEDTLFLSELNEWKNRYPHRFIIVHLFSHSKNLLRARLNGFLLKELIHEYLEYAPEQALFYTCGPVDYMDVCRITILGLGFLPEQVKRETFILPEDELDEDDTTIKVVDTNTYTVHLHFGGEVHTLEVPYPKRILEVALQHKIPLPYSCSGGVCSTCTATCIKGSVRMDYNEVLTDQEVAAGRVLVCTAHPTQNDTVITWKV